MVVVDWVYADFGDLLDHSEGTHNFPDFRTPDLHDNSFHTLDSEDIRALWGSPEAGWSTAGNVWNLVQMNLKNSDSCHSQDFLGFLDSCNHNCLVGFDFLNLWMMKHHSVILHDCSWCRCCSSFEMCILGNFALARLLQS